MRTVASFEHKGKSVQIRKASQLGPSGGRVMYKATIDGNELDVLWPDAAQLEKAIRALIDEGTNQ